MMVLKPEDVGEGYMEIQPQVPMVENVNRYFEYFVTQLDLWAVMGSGTATNRRVVGWNRLISGRVQFPVRVHGVRRSGHLDPPPLCCE